MPAGCQPSRRAAAPALLPAAPGSVSPEPGMIMQVQRLIPHVTPLLFSPSSPILGIDVLSVLPWPSSAGTNAMLGH